ncbi:TetR/AcrR family transcriptional regulator [Nocardia uniformis]|uniref:TetR/AcrR family transcriptional regulator n=1 Tax=Nocardia uniformis TaxID=53432 RepID=A0A849C7R2_9NOCA|nr:TetR/AcrR family transcriptional regulator [Nocardia uniformis]NNH70919.1 TetR/AcrR family transcriptional regulator [Nocardia uniformis]
MGSNTVPYILAGAQGLPPLPPATLDPLLDAAARCFARFGIDHTSVPDVARELRVNRATVYRLGGNIEQLKRLLVTREGYRMMAELATRVDAPLGPEQLVETMTWAITHIREHPVVARILAGDANSVPHELFWDVDERIPQIASLVLPLIDSAISGGHLARRDPRVVAEWVIRISASLIAVQPEVGTEQFLAEILIPALTPARSRKRE